ncbi:MAG: hypothetical protein RLZZ301_544 [Bacteroidota bacterium]|jgi:uncharacterized protein YbbC (DUF1343 family)
MKRANDMRYLTRIQKYTKQLASGVLSLFLLASCGLFDTNTSPAHFPVAETIVIEEDSLLVHPVLEESRSEKPEIKQVQLGIDRLHLLVDSLKDLRIAVVSNQTSVVNGTHLVDTLLALQFKVVKVFSPEHGFRGDLDAGQHVDHSIDEKTGLPLVSLYGNNKKPSAEQLADVDLVIYDIQDVGVRFYTYISTLHYVMEACAEQHKQLVVLDRPNPNGHYVDGPVLEPAFKSFVGMHPVPIVYGMTIGEYAMMINGEGWLHNQVKCQLWVIPCKNYKHKLKYTLPVAPSPNLRTDAAIALYPSLCLFEATTVSVGRGTETPFEVYGHPNFPNTGFSFIPVPIAGAKNPLHQNKVCYGYQLGQSMNRRSYELNLSYLINAKELLSDKAEFIDQSGFFNRLAGTASLKEQLDKGWSAKEIRETWQPGLQAFLAIRKKYLLYQ